MVLFSGQPTFGLFSNDEDAFPLAPPIRCRPVRDNTYSNGMTRDEWIQYCAKIWVDVFNSHERSLAMNQGNWIPNGEYPGKFFESVRTKAERLYREQNQQ